MDTKIVIVDIDRCETLLAEPERFCSGSRLEAVGRIGDRDRRMQGLAAELALSYALSGEAMLPPEYGYDERGRPVMANGHVSLAHSGRYGVCAVSDAPVGVDIEVERSVSPSAARRMLCPAELSRFEKGEEPLYVLKKFVTKEAYLKMTGEGVFGGMNEVYETEGRVFRNGVMIGFVYEFGDGFIGMVVTAEETEIELLNVR